MAWASSPWAGESWAGSPAAGGSATDLTIQDATHAHTADGLTITVDSTLAIADATHAHTADNLSLTVTGSTDLVVQDALHSHAADNLDLTVDGSIDLTIDSATLAHTADNVTLTTEGDNVSLGGRKKRMRRARFQDYDVPMPAEVVTGTVPSDKVVEPIAQPAAAPSKLAPKSVLRKKRTPGALPAPKAAPVIQDAPAVEAVAQQPATPPDLPAVAAAPAKARPMMLSDILQAEDMTREELIQAVKTLARIQMGPQLIRSPRAKLIRQAQ